MQGPASDEQAGLTATRGPARGGRSGCRGRRRAPAWRGRSRCGAGPRRRTRPPRGAHRCCGAERGGWAESPAEELDRYRRLALRVSSQASQRGIEGRPVADKDKLLSIFEPHTVRIERGKAGELFEYGHMIQVPHVDGCFLTSCAVSAEQPNGSSSLPAAVERHKRQFVELPDGASPLASANRSRSERLEDDMRLHSEDVADCRSTLCATRPSLRAGRPRHPRAGRSAGHPSAGSGASSLRARTRSRAPASRCPR